MTKKLKEQILNIRNSGLTNMYDKKMVQRLAYDRDFFELVCYIEDEPGKYANFITYGNEEGPHRVESEVSEDA